MIVLGTLLSVAPAWAADTSLPSVPLPKWGPFVDLQLQPGTQRSLGESDLFVPMLQNESSLLFTDIRARLDNSNSREGNFGLGVRHMLDSGWNLGGYGYFDRRYTRYDDAFNQVTLGAEALSLDWDLRANGYIPLGDRVKPVDSLNTATISGASILFRGGEEVAMGGFDGEVGWRIPVFARDADQQLRVYAGGYRFDGDNVPVVAGPRLRLDLTMAEIPSLWIGSRLELSAEVQDDRPRGTQYFASVRLRIPLDIFGQSERVAQLTAMERRMEDPVVRDVDIVSQAGAFGPPEAATATNGGAITVLNSATTTGANLPTAVVNAGANSTVVLSGSYTTSGTITLQSGQTVVGGGSLIVRAPDGRTATLAAPSATITGNLGGTNYTVTMANNSTLSGMTIDNTDATGNNALAVLANGISDAKIIGNTLNATETGAGTAHGVDIVSSASNVTVSGNTITTKGGAIALAIQVNGSSATVTGNTLNVSGATTGNYAVDLVTANILSGSSGNTVKAGSCNIGTAGTGGTVTFANATACGP